MNLNTLAKNIKPLDVLSRPATSDAERDYFRHYGINFEETDERVTHFFGHLECDRYTVVCHYYALADAVGTCFIVHGYFDHAGLYSKVIAHCLQQSLAVVIFDLPGHGLSTGARASIASFGDYQLVLGSVLAYFEGRASAPWVAIGQSTGAAILMDFLLSVSRPPLQKVVLLAPLYRPAGWGSARLLHTLVYPFLKRIKRTFLANSSDREFLDFLKNRDPLQYRFLSLDWVAALKRWLKYFDRLPASGFAPLIIQGRRDTTVDWRHNIPVIKEKFPQATVFYLQEGCHHLVNESEPIRAKMLAAIDLYFADLGTGAGNVSE